MKYPFELEEESVDIVTAFELEEEHLIIESLVFSPSDKQLDEELKRLEALEEEFLACGGDY